jgi:hypothetical protein
MAIKLSDRLAKLQDPYLICRTRRHNYEDIPDSGALGRKWNESKSVARLSQRCERCGTVREEAWNRYTGDLLFASYRYPSDYKISGGAKPKNLRKEYLERRQGSAKFGEL